MVYDLEERTLQFSKDVLRELMAIQQNAINKPMMTQLIRASSSVGANYREANAASSRKDFKNKIAISRKEIQETKYWIELLAECTKEKENLKKLWKEAQELSLIFNKIFHSLNRSN